MDYICLHLKTHGQQSNKELRDQMVWRVVESSTKIPTDDTFLPRLRRIREERTRAATRRGNGMLRKPAVLKNLVIMILKIWAKLDRSLGLIGKPLRV
jgi:hypothetical protein